MQMEERPLILRIASNIQPTRYGSPVWGLVRCRLFLIEKIGLVTKETNVPQTWTDPWYELSNGKGT